MKKFAHIDSENGLVIAILTYSDNFESPVDNLVEINDDNIETGKYAYFNNEFINIEDKIWDKDQNKWVEDLDKYRNKMIEILKSKRDVYLNSKINTEKRQGLLVLASACNYALTKQLSDKDKSKINEIMLQILGVFNWITDVVNYSDSIENQIKNAGTKNEIDEIINNVNFSIFDDSFNNVTIADKMSQVNQILSNYNS